MLCFGLPRVSGPSGHLHECTLGVNAALFIARGSFERLLALDRSDDCHLGGFCLLIYCEPLRFF